MNTRTSELFRLIEQLPRIKNDSETKDNAQEISKPILAKIKWLIDCSKNDLDHDMPEQAIDPDQRKTVQVYIGNKSSATFYSTPFVRACLLNQVELAEMLYDYHPDKTFINDMAFLYSVCINNSLHTLNLLLQKKWITTLDHSIVYHHVYERTNKVKTSLHYSPLYIAANKNFPEMTAKLLLEGAKPDFAPQGRKSPLEIATLLSHKKESYRIILAFDFLKKAWGAYKEKNSDKVMKYLLDAKVQHPQFVHQFLQFHIHQLLQSPEKEQEYEFIKYVLPLILFTYKNSLTPINHLLENFQLEVVMLLSQYEIPDSPAETKLFKTRDELTHYMRPLMIGLMDEKTLENFNFGKKSQPSLDSCNQDIVLQARSQVKEEKKVIQKAKKIQHYLNQTPLDIYYNLSDEEKYAKVKKHTGANNDYDNITIVSAAKTLLTSFGVKGIHTMIVGPDRPGDKWNFMEQLKKNMTDEYHASKYTLFAYPSNRGTHSVAVVIDRVGKQFLIADSEGNENRALTEAFKEIDTANKTLEELKNYLIRYNAARQQGYRQDKACGEYSVRNFICMILFLTKKKIDPRWNQLIIPFNEVNGDKLNGQMRTMDDDTRDTWIGIIECALTMAHEKEKMSLLRQRFYPAQKSTPEQKVENTPAKEVSSNNRV